MAEDIAGSGGFGKELFVGLVPIENVAFIHKFVIIIM